MTLFVVPPALQCDSGAGVHDRCRPKRHREQALQKQPCFTMVAGQQCDAALFQKLPLPRRGGKSDKMAGVLTACFEIIQIVANVNDITARQAELGYQPAEDLLFWAAALGTRPMANMGPNACGFETHSRRIDDVGGGNADKRAASAEIVEEIESAGDGLDGKYAAPHPIPNDFEITPAPGFNLLSGCRAAKAGFDYLLHDMEIVADFIGVPVARKAGKTVGFAEGFEEPIFLGRREVQQNAIDVENYRFGHDLSLAPSPGASRSGSGCWLRGPWQSRRADHQASAAFRRHSHRLGQ